MTKDAGVASSIEAARIARSLGYGVTGNFLVDPDWDEAQFEELWDFVAKNGFQRAGYTILTPLPGTELFQKLAPILEGQPWFKYDMHHVLWEPRLGAKRFFELYAETWRRSILNTSGEKSWIEWMRQVRPAQIPYLTRVLMRTQRMMKAAGVPEGARGGAADQGGCAAAGARGLLSPSGLDRALPDGERLSFHRTSVRATRERVWEAILARDLASSAVSKALLALRGYGGRAFAGSRGTFPEKLQRFGFTKLEEVQGRELVFGIAGKFWRHDGGLRPIPDRPAVHGFRGGRLREGRVEHPDRGGRERHL